MVTDYKVTLDAYNGPLDLLLFLIKREEVDIYDIPIANITEQYLQYVDMLQSLDPELVSEFLVLAATLMEIKSRTLLPRPPIEEGEEDTTDPRLELVRQLLEYRTFKDAARSLEDSADKQAMRFPRRPATMPQSQEDDIELDNLELWDLVDAFRRMMEETGKAAPMHHVEFDDTPISLHADDMLDSLKRAGGRQAFEDVFRGRPLGQMIGLFLAMLELIRHGRIQVTQEQPFAPILIRLINANPIDIEEEPAETNLSMERPTDPLPQDRPEEDVADQPADMIQNTTAPDTHSVDQDQADSPKSQPASDVLPLSPSTTSALDDSRLQHDPRLPQDSTDKPPTQEHTHDTQPTA